MIKIGIVEDEIEEIRNLKEKLDTYFSQKDLAYGVSSYEKPLEFIDQFSNQFDIIFLDIEMPYCNGIDVAKSIREKDKNVILIFSTRMVSKALEGYSVKAYDFIVKPVVQERLDKLMDELTYKLSANKKETITVKMNNNVTKVLDTDEIVHIEIVSHLLLIELYQGDTLELWMPLSEIEKILPISSFIRISNSVIINMNYVEEIRGDTLMVKGRPLKVSRSKKKEFLDKFSRFVGE